MATVEAWQRPQARRLDGLGRGAKHELAREHGWGSTRPFALFLATRLLADYGTMPGRAGWRSIPNGARCAAEGARRSRQRGGSSFCRTRPRKKDVAPSLETPNGARGRVRARRNPAMRRVARSETAQRKRCRGVR